MHSNLLDRFGKVFWLVMTVLIMASVGIVVFVEIRQALPAFLLGIPAGVLVGKWLCTNLSVARLAVATALSLFLIWYSSYSSRHDNVLALTSYLFVITYIVLTSIPSSHWGSIRRKVAGTREANRKVSILAIFVTSAILLPLIGQIIYKVVTDDVVINENWTTVFIGIVLLALAIRQFKSVENPPEETPPA